MKNISFKAKTTIWITLLISVVCAISIASILLMSRRVANSEIKQTLISTVEGNLDEIEYKNGILEIESDFAFYSDGIYCDVYNDNFEYINGGTPQSLIDYTEFSSGEIKEHSRGNGEYYIYDAYLDFRKYEYEIDVFSGQIIQYDADVAGSDAPAAGEYFVTRFENGIDTETAIDIALNHAGATRENSTIITAEIPSYENRQVFKIEFICTEPLNGGVWVRGIVPANTADGAFGAVNKAVVYVIPVFIIIAALGAYLLSKRTIRPVENITRSAKEISSGSDLSKRIEADGGSNEISALAETFNGMLSRLQNSFESEKQFTSDASHELRTPLAVIKAECEYALSQNADSEDKEEALVSINEQSDKMTALVNALLSLTRTEQGTERFNFEKTNMSELVEGICSSFTLSKGIKLQSSVEKDIFFNMDISLISRLLENLLSNAVRYGRENGYINVILKRDRDKIILTVEDNGIGIKEEELPKIWGRFYRADSSRSSSDGFGLGLALVERIAALHGGRAEAQSEFGKGSKFIITFFEKV